MKHREPTANTSHDLALEAAGERLSTTSTALRARCRRHARREGKEVLAHLGEGVVAYKFGSHWRVRFTELEPHHADSAPSSEGRRG